MADDAYPVQIAGVTFSADEIRRAHAAFFSAPGVISGLVLSGGTGEFSVTSGVAAVADDASQGYILAPTSTTETRAVPAAATPRVDTVYLAVNDTVADVVVNGNTYTPGKAYVERANNTTTIPAKAIVVGRLEVSGTTVTATTVGRQYAQDPLAEGRYLRRDQADALFSGTTASTPTASGHVATKGYVDSGAGVATSVQALSAPAITTASSFVRNEAIDFVTGAVNIGSRTHRRELRIKLGVLATDWGGSAPHFDCGVRLYRNNVLVSDRSRLIRLRAGQDQGFLEQSFVVDAGVSYIVQFVGNTNAAGQTVRLTTDARFTFLDVFTRGCA